MQTIPGAVPPKLVERTRTGTIVTPIIPYQKSPLPPPPLVPVPQKPSLFNDPERRLMLKPPPLPLKNATYTAIHADQMDIANVDLPRHEIK